MYIQTLHEHFDDGKTYTALELLLENLFRFIGLYLCLSYTPYDSPFHPTPYSSCLLLRIFFPPPVFFFPEKYFNLTTHKMPFLTPSDSQDFKICQRRRRTCVTHTHTHTHLRSRGIDVRRRWRNPVRLFTTLCFCGFSTTHIP